MLEPLKLQDFSSSTTMVIFTFTYICTIVLRSNLRDPAQFRSICFSQLLLFAILFNFVHVVFHIDLNLLGRFIGIAYRASYRLLIDTLINFIG